MTEHFAQPEGLLAQTAWLRRLAAELVRGADAADELTQATVVAALSGEGPKRANIRTWLESIARRIAAGTTRAHYRRLRRERIAAKPDVQPSAAATFERFGLHRQVVDAVESLDERHRAVVLMRYWEELPPREIAKRLGLPVETVRSRLKRGIALLRDKLDSEYGDRRAWAAPLSALAKRGVTSSLAIGGVWMTAKLKWTVAATVVAGLALWVGSDLLWNRGESQPDAAPAAPVVATLPEAEAAAVAGEAEALVERSEVAAEVRGFRGRVVDVSGAGLGDVEVCLLTREQALSSLHLDDETVRLEGDAFDRAASSDLGLHLFVNPGTSTNPNLFYQRMRSDWHLTRTDTDGAFQFPDVDEVGGMILAAWAPEHGARFARLTDGENDKVVVFGDWLTISGRVTTGGEPVPGVDICVYGRERTIHMMAKSGDDGRFATLPIPPGEYAIRPQHPDFRSAGEGWQRIEADREYEFRLERLPRLQAALVDTQHQPWTAQRLTELGWDVERLSWILTDRPYDDRAALAVDAGVTRVEFDALTGRLSASIENPARRFLSGWAGGLVAAVELDDFAVSAVQVKIEAPTPPSGATLQVDLAVNPAIQATVFELSLAPWHGITSQTARIAGATGQTRFELPVRDHQRGQRLYLLVRGDGFADSVTPIEIPETGPLEPTRVRVDLGTETLVGEVVDADGEPLDGVEVSITATNGEPLRHPWEARTMTDEAGRFEFPRMVKQKVRVYAAMKSYAAIARNIEVGDRPKLVLERGREIRVIHTGNLAYQLRILDVDGGPVIDDRVSGTKRFGIGRTLRFSVRAKTIEAYRPGERSPFASVPVPEGDEVVLR